MAVYELPDLPYAFDALEPHISAEIMELHHDKHHATYVAGANAALEAVVNMEVAPRAADSPNPRVVYARGVTILPIVLFKAGQRIQNVV